MQVRLGKVQLVKAIDDDDVSVSFRRDLGSSRLSRRVILSVEVAAHIKLLGKTEKRANENDEDTANRHTAQLYVEMLSQACHSEFYDKMHNEYQEVLYSGNRCH